jgi:alpha-L-fucosidase 2
MIMKRLRTVWILSLGVMTLQLTHILAAEQIATSAAPPAPLCLWYLQPAAAWEEALPVGNGRLGAMVYGGWPNEHIQFNEHTLWTGQPRSYAHEGAVKVLPELRRLLQQMRQDERAAFKNDPKGVSPEAKELLTRARAKQKAAEDLAMKDFMSVPIRQEAYQPCGDLWIEFPPAQVEDYRRWLDLDLAVGVTEHRAGDVRHRREVFASYPDQTIFVRLTATQPGQISCLIRLTTPHKSSQTTASDGVITLRGLVGIDGVRFESRAAVTAEGGTVIAETSRLRVVGANSVVLRLVAATSVKNYRDITADPSDRCAELLRNTAAKTWDDAQKTHLADHQALFRRVHFDLGHTPAAQLPTDQRIKDFASSQDPRLAVLTFQYGRYLLIACSRPGGQPANLQGIWNDKLNPPWDSKYTCNINTEMNYWPAETANLAECAAPLFDALEDLAVTGAEVARAHYGARGWVVHHNFDLWRGAAPINAANHGIWLTGAAWLSTHLWEHYLFSQDKDFLAQRAYPLMKGAAQFFIDTLVEDPITGWLISGPSNSPEQGGLVMGPAMDHAIIRCLFKACLQATQVLDTDRGFADDLANQLPRLAPSQVGQYGQLQEWIEDKDDPNNTHRHVSHLWGIYPGDDITWRDPDLFKAARQSLVFRGDAATGWSMGWKVNLWARFLDGDHAFLILRNLLRPIAVTKGQGGVYPNLFDAHPPFQIDGNFGATAGIAEMLIQSHTVDPELAGRRFEINLLPALPKVWADGAVRGLKARGGFEVGLQWKNARLSAVTVKSTTGAGGRLRYGSRTADLNLKPGQTKRLDGSLQPIP